MRLTKGAARLTKTSLVVAIGVLSLAVTGAGMYIGRLRWQNAMLRADLARAQRRLAAVPSPRVPAAVVTTDRTLSDEQRRAMLDRLSGETSAQKDVWFAWAADDREAAAYQRSLQGVFEQAGWKVRRSAPAAFSLRPGIFFLMADASPPSYVLTALAAIQQADGAVSSGRDYRAFHERKKRDDASWRGFDMDADQTYIIAIGRWPSDE
jgi:hypothetical protein